MNDDKGLVERLLSPIADVKRGEAAGALLMMLTMFLILGGYYLLKTAREIFILSQGGAAVKSYSSAGQALLLLIIVPAYGALASRVNRRRLTQWMTLFFASNLLLFLAALSQHWRIGIVYFLWIGVFNLMVVAQYWAFANDLYTPEQGKRLFPLIGIGSSLGAWLGSVRAGTLLEAEGPWRLLAGGFAVLIVCAGLAGLIIRMTERGSPSSAARDERPLDSGKSGFGMVLSDRYLLLIAALILVLNVVNTSGGYFFDRYVTATADARFGAGPEAAAAREQFIGQTYSGYFGYVNLVGFLLQTFAVSRIFRWLGVGRTLWIHPIVALAGYLVMLRAPSFEIIRWLKIADNSIEYSLANTARQALWLPTSPEAKYKAKQAVDAFCVRIGDVIQAGVVYTGELLSFTVTAFAALNIVFVLCWLGIVRGLNRSLRARGETKF
ncbi:MAG TPA: MFS transporter [Vicinamibacterales bacterium]|nr:MFS transporter [Vicinamibacterales bacterium]